MVRGKVFLVLLFSLSVMASAQDAQWRGENRDGRYTDSGLLKSWPEGGPELILKKEGLGNGYSTPILYEGNIY
ncbi:MAG: alcohol dehydrogenase, partial [Bacteroides sp.]|nr:alcohol dehydrogenase [Bacteroides sp.]